MSFLRSALAALATFTIATAAHASAIYDYSFTFQDTTTGTQHLVTGKVTGTLFNNSVIDLSNIYASVDGVALASSGSLMNAAYDSTGTFRSGLAKLNLTGSNSFIFGSNITYAIYNGQSFLVSAFDSISFVGGYASVLQALPGHNVNTGGFQNKSTVTLDPANVPEPASATLFGIALLGFAAARRRNS